MKVLSLALAATTAAAARTYKYSTAQHTTTSIGDGCLHNTVNDQIEYVQINADDGDTMKVTVGYKPQGGGWTMRDGVSVQCWHYTVGDRKWDSTPLLDKQDGPGSGSRTHQFKFRPERLHQEKHAIRCGIIDRSSKTCHFDKGNHCASRTAGAGSYHHYDNADVQFSVGPDFVALEKKYSAAKHTLVVPAMCPNVRVFQAPGGASGEVTYTMERAACDADAMSVAYLDEVPKGPAVDENFVVLSRTEHDEAEAYRAAHPERIAAAKKKHAASFAKMADSHEGEAAKWEKHAAKVLAEYAEKHEAEAKKWETYHAGELSALEAAREEDLKKADKARKDLAEEHEKEAAKVEAHHKEEAAATADDHADSLAAMDDKAASVTAEGELEHKEAKDAHDKFTRDIAAKRAKEIAELVAKHKAAREAEAAKAAEAAAALKTLYPSIEYLESPKNVRFSCRGASTATATPPGVPADAKAVIATISTYDSNRNDHTVHSFGRDNSHRADPWNNNVYDLNTYFNDVMVAHNGDHDSGGGFHYGHSFGTSVVPIKGGKIDARLCMGHNSGSQHYVTLEVYGYIPGASSVVFVSKPKNIRTTCSGHATKRTLSVPSGAGIPSDAKAVYATVTTYNSNRNDHVTHSFGRDSSHNSHTWDNRVYDLNTYLNDVMITHEGDSSGNFYYGHSHGSQLIPLTAANQIESQLCMGHSRGTHYVTLQVYGYTTGSAPKAPCPSSLQAHYTFDGHWSASAKGSHNWATSYAGSGGIEGTSGKHATALNFNGDDRIAVHAGGAVSENNFGVSMWFKTSNSNAGGLFCLDHHGHDRHFGISSDRMYIRTWPHGAQHPGHSGMASNTWRHAVYTVGPSGEKIFVDGALIHHRAHVKSSSYNWDQNAYIGWSTDRGYFHGQIDEVRIYNHELSQTEVNGLYTGCS